MTLSWMGAWSAPVRRHFFIGRDMTESRQAQETLARERTAGARHHQQRDRRLRPGRSARRHPGLESAGRSHVRMAARGGARQEPVRPDGHIRDGRGRCRTALEGFLLSGQEQVRQPRREIQIKRRDGTRIYRGIEHLRAQDPRRLRVQRFIRDITERSRTQQTLRQQTEELRRIFETSQDLILVMDSRGSLVQISPSCETILGYRPGEMIGRSGVDFIHPDHLENSRQEMRAPAARAASEDRGHRCVHKDGREVWLSWLGVWSEPAKRFFFVGRDMTESRRAQETLRESEQLARGIIDTALDAFVQMDEQGAISDWNSQAEKIFGWSREEAVGNRPQRTDHPGSPPRRAQRRPGAVPAHRRRRHPRPPLRNRGDAARRQGNSRSN